MNLDAAIDSLLSPIADMVSGFIFSSITIGGVKVEFLVALLITAALFFTVRTGFIGFWGFKHAIKLITDNFVHNTPNGYQRKKKGELSSFQALSATISASAGIGNVAGSAAAVSIGGPGVIFWMIIAGLFSMALKFSEVLLGVKFRQTNHDGTVSGGPMYYIPIAFKGGIWNKWSNSEKFGNILAKIYAICAVFAMIGGWNLFQINAMTAQFTEITGGNKSIFTNNGWILGTIVALITWFTIIGGYQFGTLTTKSGHVIKLEDFDKDGDGKISQQEYLFIQKELGVDTLELSEAEKKGEKQVTDEEYVVWALEIQTDNILNDFISKVAKDFIGSNAVYSSNVIAELREFSVAFKASYNPANDDISELADKFAEVLQVKYDEIKETLLGSNDKDYLKVQEDWDKYVKDFEKNIASAGSIDEFVKLNRDYIKEHGEYIQKMLACNDLSSEERQALIQESKGDFAQIEYFSNLSGEGRNMQAATNQFIEKLAENCSGWKDLMENPIIKNPDLYMLQYFYEYRDNPNPLKESMTVEYWKHLNQQYSMLELQYHNLVESGQINPEDDVEYKPKGH